MIVVKKLGKLARELSKEDYSLWYGKNSLFVQKKGLQKFKYFDIVDDLLATGRTVSCV